MPINDQLASRLTEQAAQAPTSTQTNQEDIGGQFINDLESRGLINFDVFDPSGFATSNARASRSAALKQLNIQRKKLEFQKKTGLRDISQARTIGLKGAINNALQRGIFNSGIRITNEAEVNRESDEAAGDLKTNIQFALDDLSARRQGLNAQKFGSPTPPGGQLTKGTAAELANEAAAFELNKPQPVIAGPGSDLNLRRNTDSGIIQFPRPDQGGIG